MPLLFNLVAESLPILVNQFEENQWLQGLCINGMLERATVFQYAGDTILFLDCSKNMEVRFCICLLIFSIISGLCVNLHKSSLIRVGIDLVEVNNIVLVLGCQVGSLPMKYLGLQLGGR